MNSPRDDAAEGSPDAAGTGGVRPVLALVRDLLFASRIGGAARAVGVPVTVLRDPAALNAVPGQSAQTPAPDRLIVDLNLDGAIDAAACWRCLVPGREVVGFVSHVDADTIARARAAGVDRVLARSRFVELLPKLLTGESRPGDEAEPPTPAPPEH